MAKPVKIKWLLEPAARAYPAGFRRAGTTNG